MKTRLKFLTCGLIVFVLLATSCSKDPADGDMGPIGPKGEQGIQGPKGDVGEDGTNGTNGVDGNANVSVYKFDVPASFSNKFYTEFISELSPEVLANDIILSFISERNDSMRPIPGRVGGYDFFPSYLTQSFSMFFYEAGTDNNVNIPAGFIKQVKIVIIKSSTVTGKSNNGNILAELKANGVDVNDYNAICDYYGLAY